MFSPRSSFTRILATLLPFCFAWGFVACVSLCSSHDEEPGENMLGHAASIARAHEGEQQCPVPEVLSCTLPEQRHSIAPAPPLVSGDAGEASFAASPTGSTLYLPVRHSSSPPPTSDPPLERLGVLRI